MTSLFHELTGLMVRHGFKPNKKLGQHFLIDASVIEQMVKAAELNDSDTVLEIGPGTGFLSRELAKACRVEAIELDQTLAGLLEKELSHEKFHLTQGDFLKVPLPPFNKVVSCPPFNISSEIMYKLFLADIDLAILLLQKEFAEKLTALPGYPEYTAISFLAQYFFEIEILFHVSIKSFFPTPKTPCVVVKVSPARKHGQAKDDIVFTKFIKSVFRFKNKSLANALKYAFPFLEKELKQSKDGFLKAIGKIEPELREEKVYALDFEELVEAFNQLTPSP
jgi:16S rRNA (adenine1518-N6/adenine1519-N6)-dimethyltransferase